MWPAVLATALSLAGCSGGGRTVAGATPPAGSGVPVPLDATLATATGAVVVVAMGRLGDPLNTFWQLFVRPAGAPSWTLATPPGVADNGGLVVGESAVAAGGDASILAGFEPSQELEFSPLARSDDQGGAWTPGLVPGPLAPVPDALAVSDSGVSFALLRRRGGVALRSTGDDSAWSVTVRRSVLATSPAGRSCGVGSLTAVSASPSGSLLLGASCARPGAVGIFTTVGGTLRSVGPGLGPALRPGPAPVTVLRLVDPAGAPSALVAARQGGETLVFGLAMGPSGAWSRSPALVLPRGDRLVSTGVGPTGGFVVQTTTSTGTGRLEVEDGAAGAWRPLPAPPARTAAVVVAGEAVDALTVDSTVLTDWRLDPATDSWTKMGTVKVPIEFGSSS